MSLSASKASSVIIQRVLPWLVTVDHRELLTGAAHSHRHGCFSYRGEAPTAHISVDQCGLVTLVNLSAFASCALLYGRVLTF